MSQAIKPERNYGIDALRIVSMIMIILLHVTGQGGVIRATEVGSRNYNAAWLVEMSSYGAVNCYALISGYVSGKGAYRYSRLLMVWIQTVAYCLAITAAFAIFVPSVVSVKSWVSCFLPISTNQYWYVTSYFGMFLLVPFLDMGIHNLSRRQLGLFTVSALIFYMLMPCLTSVDGLLPSPERAEFNLNMGYSTIWLCICYITGGYAGKYELGAKLRSLTSVLIYLLSVIISWLLELSGFHSFLSYCSPFVFLSAFSLLLLFSRLQFHREFTKKFLVRLSATTLGVYQIHSHPLVWLGLISGLTAGFAVLPPALMCLCLIGAALAIFIVSSGVDMIRQWIFKLLRIDSLAKKLDKLIPW